MSRETIFALATPAAKSGVAIIRISGKQSLYALRSLTGKQSWEPNIARFVTFSRATDHDPRFTIDRGIALFFKAPKSFTGEDVVELHTHGSIAVIRELLDTLAQVAGLRPAEPGEFTRRAFINHKMDLIEAEGLADLIEAETPAQKAQALLQMQGNMSRVYEKLRTQIITALAHLEAYIDFPDEEIPPSVLSDLTGEVSALKTTIAEALSDGKRGEKLRQGLSIVILGAPNAGKSSLLNAIAGRDAAIVSHRAGTTRDVIEIHMDLGGFPVTLMDTAGIRDTTDDIEEEGVRRALERAASADIKLVLFDGAYLPELDPRTQELMDANSIAIISKCDMVRKRPPDMLSISTQSGEGLDELLKRIEFKIASLFSSKAAPLITRNRHRTLLSEAFYHLEKCDLGGPLELACEELRLAASCVAKITGKIAVDDVLDVVFKQFCIGK